MSLSDQWVRVDAWGPSPQMSGKQRQMWRCGELSHPLVPLLPWGQTESNELNKCLAELQGAGHSFPSSAPNLGDTHTHTPPLNACFQLLFLHGTLSKSLHFSVLLFPRL